ncbi:TetR/AcrR family transcriptional regulator [Arthrobacter sp. 35W]|uniref:TetR/AcrR family transcriptional regulator n=1 Tax=Arthrobacter sp. 35W TaxID=1132441 RepID=UPI0003F5DC66|nr:TetR family transcriptional regulator [Arthrobacter sp. 35W]
MAAAPRRGRRSGQQSSREAIVAAARMLFARQGFDATSLREVAREAGVDAAMVHHYFTGKDDLFAACIELPADPATVLAAVAARGPGERGEATVAALLSLWDSPVQPALLAMLRSAVGSPAQAALLREVLLKRVVGLVVRGLPDDDAGLRLRGSLVASQLMGLLMARYILKVEPLASADHATITTLIAPTLQRYLTGPLD